MLDNIFPTNANSSGKDISGHSGSNNHPDYYSVGIHPWSPDKSLMEKICEYASLPTVLAIGETGLDKITAKNIDDFNIQQELFTEHIILSEKVEKPLIIHCVKAWEELLRMHKTAKPLMPWIIHGFKGKAVLAEQLLNAGIYLSFGVTHNTDSLKAAWDKQRVFAETDDTNADIRDIYKDIANKLNISTEELSVESETLFNTIINDFPKSDPH